MHPSDCRIVLVRPRDPNNIGAVARAMKNFGLHDLWIVGIHPPTWEEVTSAPNALDVLTGARVVATLAQAVADCNLVVGTTDRTRVEATQTVYTPLDLSRQLAAASYNLALVFGSEKTGLSNDDLSHCHRVMSIPTEAHCPSMNLGQAVAICCYELVREQAQQAIQPCFAPAATAGAMQAAERLALDVLHQIDFVLPGHEAGLQRRVRAGLMRLNLSAHDVTMLCGILDRINKTISRRHESKKG